MPSGFELSTPVIPECPRPAMERSPEGDAVFRFNGGLTKQMTREEMRDHMCRVILLDLASQQRIAALEAALVQVVARLERTIIAEARCDDEDGQYVRDEMLEILGRLGLDHRLEGNQGKAKQVTA